MGPVIENFSLADPKFTTAVEVAAGNALFNVIVDTDATAARLMQHLERNRSGRLTFMPLNRLHPREQQYPASNDVAPLIEVCATYCYMFVGLCYMILCIHQS
jgi:structural maintenance of chromosome 3 (chondroitin sulfate proteoglycan 6)